MLRKLNLLFLVALVMAPPAMAKPKEHPQKLVKDVTQDVLEVLREDKQRLAKDIDYLNKKVEELILPHMDFVAMSKLVLGPHWKKASEAQQEAFVTEFKRLLVRTYQKSLMEFSNEKVKFKPFQESNRPEKLALVRAEIVRGTGKPIPMSYKLRYKESDGWKVYDIGVEGVSLVTNYRASFHRQISQHGIDHLIDSLKKRNTLPDQTGDGDTQTAAKG